MYYELLESDQKLSRKEMILRTIRTRPGVANWELAAITFKFNSRISDLRKDGYEFKVKRDYKKGKATNVFRYWLDTEREYGDTA